MPIRTRRWNDPSEPDDGYRVLICRFRPRGVPREGEPWHAWWQALAPSVELHAAAYGKAGPPLAWAEYRARFLEEMSHQRYWIDGLAERVRAGETVTLLCSSACTDEGRCHRSIVRELLEQAAFPPPPAELKPGVVRRAKPPQSR